MCPCAMPRLWCALTNASHHLLNWRGLGKGTIWTNKGVSIDLDLGRTCLSSPLGNPAFYQFHLWHGQKSLEKWSNITMWKNWMVFRSRYILLPAIHFATKWLLRWCHHNDQSELWGNRHHLRWAQQWEGWIANDFIHCEIASSELS